MIFQKTSNFEWKEEFCGNESAEMEIKIQENRIARQLIINIAGPEE